MCFYWYFVIELITDYMFFYCVVVFFFSYVLSTDEVDERECLVICIVTKFHVSKCTYIFTVKFSMYMFHSKWMLYAKFLKFSIKNSYLNCFFYTNETNLSLLKKSCGHHWSSFTHVPLEFMDTVALIKALKKYTRKRKKFFMSSIEESLTCAASPKLPTRRRRFPWDFLCRKFRVNKVYKGNFEKFSSSMYLWFLHSPSSKLGQNWGVELHIGRDKSD